MRFALAQLNFTVGAFDANFARVAERRRRGPARPGADSARAVGAGDHRAIRRAIC